MNYQDPLSQFIESLAPRCEVFAQVELFAPWGIKEQCFEGGSAFTFLRKGRCVVEVEGHDPIHLKCGQLIILPHGSCHEKKSDEDAVCLDSDFLFNGKTHSEISQMRIGGCGEESQLMCGYIDFSLAQHWGRDAQMGIAPDIMLIDVQKHSRLEQLIVWLEEEVGSELAGHTLASQRVLELILIEIMRQTLASDHPPSWLSGLSDRHISPAVLFVQRHFAEEITVPQLAEVAALSKSAFSDRFKEMTGVAPLQFVRQWRCFIGAKLLAGSHMKIEEIATQIGFQSSDVFIRNFKQFHDITPKQYRQQTRPQSKKIDDLTAIADV
ncbi:AraC family transcriptional regulator [Vibrio sonorensis]|uniref:AraC family transcriptional regulator n=1 Tax=Vibrio sonorensis TaxID=1004316 RepID=UPI0008DA183C|nr:AraC family transcriptional regulator [Vibrio sonorensis]